MTTIAVANQKGGVGKTTSSLNIAVYLAKSGKKVLVVDLDPQGNLTSGLGIKEKLTTKHKTIYQVLLEDIGCEEAILPTTTENLQLLPATIALAGAEVELVNQMSRETTLKHKLSLLEDKFDIVVIDCPPSLGLLTINALVASDRLIVPIQSEYYALEGLGQLLNTVKLVKKNLNTKLQLLGLVITMYDSRTNLSSEVASELSQQFPKQVFNTIIPRNIRLGEAPSHGQSILEYAPNSQGASSYQNLATEILTRLKIRT